MTLGSAASGNRAPTKNDSGSVGLDEHTVDIDDLLSELIVSTDDEQRMSSARQDVGKLLEDAGVGGGLRALRLQRGLSQQALGDLAKMAQSKIARLENGLGDPQSSTLDRLALALKCSPEILYAAWQESKESRDE